MRQDTKKDEVLEYVRRQVLQQAQDLLDDIKFMKKQGLWGEATEKPQEPADYIQR